MDMSSIKKKISAQNFFNTSLLYFANFKRVVERDECLGKVFDQKKN